jgi:tetratricopeptide (TPR) repeat protein
MTAVRAGNFNGAVRMLERARALADGNPDQQALVLLSEAYVDGELNGLETAVRRCLALVDLDGISDRTRGRIHSQLGLLHLRTGDTEAADAAYTRAIPLLVGSPEHLGRAYLNRGNLHLHRLDAHAAVADFEQARDQFALAGVTASQGKTQHNIGYAHLLLGDLVTALEQMDAAEATMNPMTPVMQAQTNQDRAEVMLAAGRPVEATKALEAAARAYGAQRLPRFQAECEFVLARTLLRDDPRRARMVARRSARRFANHGVSTWADRAEALAIAAAIRSGVRSRSLLVRADGLEVHLRRDGVSSDADQLALVAARLVLRRGDLDDASARVRRVRLGQEAPIPLRLLRHEVRADLATARRRHADARREITAGLTALHRWQSSFGSLDLQSTLVGHGAALAARGLESALDDGRPQLLYEWSERARALIGRVTPVRPPRDERIARDLAALRQLPPGDRRRSELAEQIARHAWAAPGGGEVGEPAPLDELQAGLGDAALVAHVVRPRRMAALVATAHDATVIDLGAPGDFRNRLDAIAADLDMAASRTDGPMAAAIRASLVRSLEAVADRLLAPVLRHVGDRRLVLTPSSILAGTPWSLLPGMVGRPLTIPPSATHWLSNRDTPPATRRVGLVAGPRVDRAVDEVRRAARAWESGPAAPEVLTGDDASARKVASLAERVDVLHLAGHGRHSGENPLFSAVELADGPWFGYDIDALAHRPGTVVLSACELGRVSVRSGEEAVGMSAAWLHAGARHVLSSPTLVADDVACDALAHWHALVAAGAQPAEALATVGEEVSGGPLLPFLCFGAGW